MKKSFFLIFVVFLHALVSSGQNNAQNDQQAINILDQFSAKAMNAPSVSMTFVLETVDQLESSTDTLSGSVIISKDRYKLDLPENSIWFDGQSSWNYLPAEKEVTITTPDKKDDSFQNKPSAVFSLYKKGYKSRLIEEKADSYLIDLYPEDIKTDIVRIRLSIGKQQFDLKSLEYKNREGMIYTLRIKSYSLQFKPDSGTFTFHPEKYKGVEVVDMR